MIVGGEVLCFGCFGIVCWLSGGLGIGVVGGGMVRVRCCLGIVGGEILRCFRRRMED